MDPSLRLGKLFGIPLGLNYSWFLIFGLVTWLAATHYFPATNPGWQPALYWVVGGVASLLFFASVVGHELSHSLVSLAHGIPVKGITLFIFGGVSQIARDAASPRAELLIAVAGPLTSLALAGLFWVIWLAVHSLAPAVGEVARYLATINLSLGIFNLIPGFPLDGGRALRSVLWWLSGNYRSATKVATWGGHLTAYVFMFAGLVGVLYTGRLDWLWLAFVGWFLDNVAGGSLRQMRFRDALQGLTAREVMTRDCPTVSQDLTLNQVVQKLLLPRPRDCFLVTLDGRLEGVLTLQNIRRIPQSRWAETTVQRAMTPFERLTLAQPHDEALSLLERMEEGAPGEMPVVEQGKVIGLVSRESLLSLIRTRRELGL